MILLKSEHSFVSHPGWSGLLPVDQMLSLDAHGALHPFGMGLATAAKTRRGFRNFVCTHVPHITFQLELLDATEAEIRDSRSQVSPKLHSSTFIFHQTTLEL